MYRLRPGIKQNPEKRWALPDRVFFACGACHILAYAFLQRFPDQGFRALWIKPAPGFKGNHCVVTREDGIAFDYHGWSRFDRLVAHMQAKANRWWPGWNATLIELPPDVLISEAKSRTYDGLWLREPKQFLHDALPRAERYLARFDSAHTLIPKSPLPQDWGRAPWTNVRIRGRREGRCSRDLSKRARRRIQRAITIQ